MATPRGARHGSMMQPAHGYGPTSVNLGFQLGWGAIGVEVGLEAQAAQGQELSLSVGAIAVFGSDRVVSVVIGHLVPVHGEHGAAGAETLPVARAGLVVELALPQHLQRIGKRRWLSGWSGPVQLRKVLDLLSGQGFLEPVPGRQLMRQSGVVFSCVCETNSRHFRW